jgi:hypothetical protein
MARQDELLKFKVEKYDGREEYFGSPVFVTPRGYRFLNSKPKSFMDEFWHALIEKITLPIFIAIVIAMVLAFFGLA